MMSNNIKVVCVLPFDHVSNFIGACLLIKSVCIDVPQVIRIIIVYYLECVLHAICVYCCAITCD